MKTTFKFIIIMLCFAVPELPAQRYLPGQHGIQIITGTVNGLNDFHLDFALSTYTKHANRWVLGFGYLEKRYEYEDMYIPQSQFTAEAGYYLKFLSDWRKTFFLSIGGSAMAGYETINWGDKLLFDGATINNSDAFLYGGALTFESEIYLTERVVFLANVRERLLAGSSIGNFNTQLGLGIKFIIN
jgi:hypothetical protein